MWTLPSARRGGGACRRQTRAAAVAIGSGCGKMWQLRSPLELQKPQKTTFFKLSQNLILLEMENFMINMLTEW